MEAGGLKSRVSRCPAMRHGSGMDSGAGEWAAISSLDVTVVVGAVGLGHVHLAHGVAHVVDSILAGRHALVDAVQTFSLCEAVDLVLWREAADGCGETGKAHNEQLDSCFSSASCNYICK